MICTFDPRRPAVSGSGLDGQAYVLIRMLATAARFVVLLPLLPLRTHCRKMLSCSTNGRMYTFHEEPGLDAVPPGWTRPNGETSLAPPGGSRWFWSWKLW